jgi:hypothetical protein
MGLLDEISTFLFGPPQREREVAELRDLYLRVCATTFEGEKIQNYIGALFEALDLELSLPMHAALFDLISAEQLNEVVPDFEHLDFRQSIELRKKLQKLELKNEEGGADEARDFLFGLFKEIAEQLPRANDPSPFTIPLIYALPNAKEFISRIYKSLHTEECLNRGLFQALRRQMYLNLCLASDMPPDAPPKKRFKHAIDSDLPLNRVNDTYLRGTPLHALFEAPVPLKLTYDDRFNHMHIVGGTGAGKTTLIETLIRHDIASENPAEPGDHRSAL